MQFSKIIINRKDKNNLIDKKNFYAKMAAIGLFI